MGKYFSQYRQDEFIDKVVLNKKRIGFFVDIGAHDGINLSNTYFFETKRRFKGLCVEPNPNVFEKLVENRNCNVMNVCIGSDAGTVKFLVLAGYSEMLSGIIDHYHPEHLKRIDAYIAEYGGSKKEIEVTCTTLQNIELLSNKEIDYMSIDTEGNEVAILKSIDFNRIKVNCFSIENNYNNSDIEDIMTKNGYIRVYRLGDDDIYLLKSKYNIGFRIRRRIFLYLSTSKS